MISVDTTILKELASASSVANDAIDNAVDALNRISVHNDWGCREKNAINNYAVTNRNKIRQLQENSRSFLNVITQVSNEFETSENSIMDLFSSVESLLSGVLSIPIGIISKNGTHTGTSNIGGIWIDSGKINSIIEEIKNSWKPIAISMNDGFNPFDSLEKYTVNNITEPIAVCNFEDINLE